jgi:uncharacterized protein involved in outer membrane biogenesis
MLCRKQGVSDAACGAGARHASIDMSAQPLPRSHPTFLSRWGRRALVALAIAALLLAAVWLATPYIVRDQVQTRLTGSLHRTTTVGKVDFNPFKLRVVLHDVTVAGLDGAPPLLTLDELWANISAASVWHRAPVLDALRLVHPSINLGRGADGRYSIQDLIDEAAAAPAGPPPLFSLNNIEVEGGRIAFDDAVTGRKHQAGDVALGVPFLSTLPYQTDVRVNPHLSGTFNGSRLELAGVAVPFAQQREAAIDIDIDALPLPEYVVYLPTAPRVVLADGKLTTRLRVAFVEGDAGTRALEVRGTAQLDRLAVDRRDGSSLARAQRIAVALDRVDVFGRDARIASLDIDAPALDLRRTAEGAMELAQPLFEGGGAGGKAPPWTATIARVSLKDGKLALKDEGSGFGSNLVDVAAEASNVSTRAGEKAKVALSFVTDDRIAAFKGEAELEPLVPAMSGTFDLRKFSLGLLFPYYKDVLAAQVLGGYLDLAGRFTLEPDGNVKIVDGTGSIADLALSHAGSKRAFVKLPALSASGIAVDVDARRVGIAELDGNGAFLRIVRERDGSIDATRLMKTSPTTGTGNDAATWALVVSKLALARGALDVEDRVPEPPIKLALRDVGVTAANVGNARGGKSTLTLRTRVGDRGRVAWTGALATNPWGADGKIDVTGLDLVPLRPYLESRVNVSLTAGTLGASGRFDVDMPDDGALKVTWKGNATVTDFAALDKPTSSDLLRWKHLALDDMDISLEPLRIAIGRVGVEDYFTRAIVYQDGTLNLTRLLTPGRAPEPAADAAPEAEAPRDALPVAIGRIELARGDVNFSDFFVQPNYSADLTDVTGTISAMSADLAGDVAVTARVNQTAPVEVAGRLQPFAKELSLDLKAKARDVDLPPLTPYSIKYAGYGIEKGKLTFDVHYRVENRKLSAENRLVLDQLTFDPQRVESATATKLPVLLAVALLKDSRGVIDINLPVAGSLDDPEFSVGGLIVRVIVNLITKAVTAPFALLAAAFGRGEELSTIPFAPASAALDGDGMKRLETLGKALADRPGLKLDIGGRADANLDREALRRASVETAMKREKMKTLARQGNAPASVDAVTIDAGERTRWLTAAYRESSIKDRPRNFFGMLEDVPAEKMEAMLLADAKVDDDALRALANARAQSVKEGLVSRSVAGERLFITAPRLSSESAKMEDGGARVDLALR